MPRHPESSGRPACFLIASLLTLVWMGCREQASPTTRNMEAATRGTPRSATASRPPTRTPGDQPPWRPGRRGRNTRHSPPAGRRPSRFARKTNPDGPQAAVARVTRIIDDAIDFGPTSVIWLIDVSPSAIRWGRAIRAAIRDYYPSASASGSKSIGHGLRTTIITFAKRTSTLLNATSDGQRVRAAIDALPTDSSGQEVTFAALRTALDRLVPIRVREHREVLFVIVSDEAGDDAPSVDTLVPRLVKAAIPVYVLGVSAPFGRTAAVDAAVESAKARAADTSWQPILQGPESRHLERVALPLADDGQEYELMDSGFGPFALQWLCRASGGAFFVVRQQASHFAATFSQPEDWPPAGPAPFDVNSRRTHAPSYVTESAYQQLLDSNKARRALYQAAHAPFAEPLRNPTLDFFKRSEAELKQSVDQAQRAAARIAPAIDHLYNTLNAGSGDRDKLTRPRWQAGFDLALGRVCAAKARVDGYNAMLAALKRGRPFKDPASTRWILQPAPSTDASSTLRKIAERARTSLQHVVTDHPHTPWATIARYELTRPMGWRWTESE